MGMLREIYGRCWEMMGNVWEIYMGNQLDDLPVESYNIDPAK
jgi:hypothetical protein